MTVNVRFIYFIGLSLIRCLADAERGFPHDPRRKELKLPRKPSCPSSDSVEKAANEMEKFVFLNTGVYFCLLNKQINLIQTIN